MVEYCGCCIWGLAMAYQWLHAHVPVWDGVMIELVGWVVKYIHRSGHRNHLGAVIVQFHSIGFILHSW